MGWSSMDEDKWKYLDAAEHLRSAHLLHPAATARRHHSLRRVDQLLRNFNFEDTHEAAADRQNPHSQDVRRPSLPRRRFLGAPMPSSLSSGDSPLGKRLR